MTYRAKRDRTPLSAVAGVDLPQALLLLEFSFRTEQLCSSFGLACRACFRLCFHAREVLRSVYIYDRKAV